MKIMNEKYLLNKIDNLFLESNTFIKEIEVRVINGVDVDDLKYPTSSFVETGFGIVILQTNNGIYGFGEPSPYGGDIVSIINAVKDINNHLKGKSLYDAWTYRVFDKKLLGAGYGTLENQAIVAAVSQCCVDILGKQLNIPAYKIFNSESDGIVPAYASGGMIYDDQSLDLYINEALEFKEKGFNAWKFRPSTPKGLDHFQRNDKPPSVDVKAIKQTIRDVSDACGSNFEILLDVGCRCRDINETIELCEFSMDYNVGFIEEPLPRNIELYSELISKTNIKIATGETFFSSEQFEFWSKNEAIDIFQPDVNLVGVREMIKIFSIAKKYNKQIVFHNWANSISNIANASLASSALDLCKYVESSVVYNPFRKELIENPVIPHDGKFFLTENPGLGIEIK
jgi:L-alanine-DL-glutamate epimerase-like enolase superfamily enzyme